jgi:hypothetical protein
VKKTFKKLLQQFLHQVMKALGQGQSQNNQSSGLGAGAGYLGNAPGRGGFTLKITFCPRMEPVVWSESGEENHVDCFKSHSWLVASSVGSVYKRRRAFSPGVIVELHLVSSGVGASGRATRISSTGNLILKIL